ncbi:MAG: class I SAM-dependent methyltransferase [Lentisphaeria bacterium]
MKTSTLNYYHNFSHDLATRYESADVSSLQISLAKLFVTNQKLIEFGCGSGRDAAFMVSRGFDLLAVDGTEAMLNCASTLHPELKNRLKHCILPDGMKSLQGPFHGAYSIATLMHLERAEIKSFFLHLHSLLTLDANFLFSVSISRNDVNCDEFDAKGRRFTALSKEQWFELAKSAKFELVSSHTNVDGLGRDGIVWLTAVVKKVK